GHAGDHAPVTGAQFGWRRQRPGDDAVLVTAEGDRFGETLFGIAEGAVEPKDAVALHLLECVAAGFEKVAQRRHRHFAPPGGRGAHAFTTGRGMQCPALQRKATEGPGLLLETLEQGRTHTLLPVRREYHDLEFRGCRALLLPRRDRSGADDLAGDAC